MLTVTPPDYTAEDTFTTCISRVRNRDLKRRLNAVKPTIVTEADAYEGHANGGGLHLVAQSDGVGGVTTDELVAVYEGRMVGEKSPGRSIYTAIRLLPKHGRCPFCGHRDVSTLDHVLPKRRYPALVVTPLNLVGSCKDCNTEKLTSVPTSAADSILHPYFDDVTGQTWLRARVVESDVCAILFRVRHRPIWSDDLNARLAAQFEGLKLGTLYSQQAAREMSGIRQNLVRIFGSGGAQAVKDELTYQWQSRREDQKNLWQTAFYRAISRNDWFCDGGFRLGF